MRIKNDQANVRVVAVSAARLNAIMASNKNKESLSFDDIRQAEGKTGDELSDGEIHQAAIDAGFKVE